MPQVTTSTDTTVAVTQRRGDTLQEIGTFLAYLRNTFTYPPNFRLLMVFVSVLVIGIKILLEDGFNNKCNTGDASDLV